jgi:hypothetical protein
MPSSQAWRPERSFVAGISVIFWPIRNVVSSSARGPPEGEQHSERAGGFVVGCLEMVRRGVNVHSKCSNLPKSPRVLSAHVSARMMSLEPHGPQPLDGPAGETSEMGRRHRKADLLELVRGLLLACLFVGGLGHREAMASTISAVAGQEADDHARFCRCRNCNPESCCCSPRRVKATSTPLSPSSPAPLTRPAPCLKSAPCGGDQGLPMASCVGSAGESLAHVSNGHLSPLVGGQYIDPSPSRALPARRVSRLDEPPELAAVA